MTRLSCNLKNLNANLEQDETEQTGFNTPLPSFRISEKTTIVKLCLRKILLQQKT